MSFTMLYQLLIYEFSVSIDWFVSARRIQRQSSEKKKVSPRVQETSASTSTQPEPDVPEMRQCESLARHRLCSEAVPKE